MAIRSQAPVRSPFRFNFPKTLQAIATMLRREVSRQMNYMRLIKLLYIVDRECLREIRRPLTGSHVGGRWPRCRSIRSSPTVTNCEQLTTEFIQSPVA